MDPNSLGNMMNMFNNPDTMSKMKDMMQQPEIKNMMNNPDIMSKMMGMFGGAKPEDMADVGNSSSTPTTPLEADTEELEAPSKLLFSEDDDVVLGNLKNDKYNNLQGVILGYNQERKRYIVRVSLDNNDELDNEETNENEDNETLSETDLETVTLDEGGEETTSEETTSEETTSCCNSEETTSEETTSCCNSEETTQEPEQLESVTLEPVRELEPEFCDIMIKEENLTLLNETSDIYNTPLTEID